MATQSPPTVASLGDDPTKEDLYELAQARDISGRTKMDAAQLKAALLAAEAPAPKVGDSIRVTRDAGVPWATMNTQVPVKSGAVLAVVKDPEEGTRAARLAPVGLMSHTIRASAATALHRDGQAVVV